MFVSAPDVDTHAPTMLRAPRRDDGADTFFTPAFTYVLTQGGSGRGKRMAAAAVNRGRHVSYLPLIVSSPLMQPAVLTALPVCLHLQSP